MFFARAALIFLLLFAAPLLAQEVVNGNGNGNGGNNAKAVSNGIVSGNGGSAPETVAKDEMPLSQQQEAINRLQELRLQIVSRNDEMEKLRKESKKKNLSEEEQLQIKQRLDELPKRIATLNHSFEQIALGGIDLGVFSDQTEAPFKWQDELVEITKPLFSSLKELTEKPRKIEKLRSEIFHFEQQLEVADKALSSISELQQQEPPKLVADRLKTLAESWHQREADIRSTLESREFQLSTLSGTNSTSWEEALQSLLEFFRGRGLTLGMALVAMLVVWLLARLVLWLVRQVLQRGEQSGRKRRTRDRAVRYIYRGITLILMGIGVMTVFYVRSDVLLLALMLIIVVMTIVWLKQALPKYIKEIRLLLDIGSVREGERIVYAGLPMEVKAINTFAYLRNPELEGVIRVPLENVVGEISRPQVDEYWFPTCCGDLIRFDDGSLAEVMQQTVEAIELKMARSLVRYPTTDFINVQFRNLSREGFGLPIVFGIDYQHQAICLDPVPTLMKQAVVEAIAREEYSPFMVDSLVEFKEAGANSLDFLIYLSFEGRAAKFYFNIGRAVQRALVDLCNREGWVIPFAQLTVHQGEGFEVLHQSSQMLPSLVKQPD